MTPAFLDTQLAAYLSLREALGFQMRAGEDSPGRVCGIRESTRELTGPIRAQLVLEWACQTSADQGTLGERHGA